MRQVTVTAISDFKLIFRDRSLRIFLLLPLLIFAVVLLGLPQVADLENWQLFIPLIVGGAILQTSTMFGFIYAMVLIHEKELGVARMYGVLPISRVIFVVGRLVAPTLLSIVVSLLLLFMQPFYQLYFGAAVFLSILCGLVAPALALAVALFSKNKMEGMTWFKLLNLVIALPLLVFIAPAYAKWLFWIPTYWIYKIFQETIDPSPLSLSSVIGFTFILGVIVILIHHFTLRHFSE